PDDSDRGSTMHRTPIVAAASAAATLALSGTALAQSPGEVIIEIDQPVLAPGESTTVSLLAGFDSAADFAMAGVHTSLLADSGGVGIDGAWSGVSLVSPMNGPGTSAGLPDGAGYAGIIAGQLHFPIAGPGADTSDPIAFWEATFTAPADTGPFTVDLSTLTTVFAVYIEPHSARFESRVDGLTEGAGTITVIPAPASGLILFGLVAIRRRR
ncbi:MAG: hypothetical protein AAFV77_07095, partial [Planctomycetota bacterium]